MKLHEYLNGLKGQRAAVIGAGISNIPLIDLLLDNGIYTEVHDKAEREALGDTVLRFESKGAALKLGGDYLSGLNADIIFRTPGQMPSEPRLQKALKDGAILTSEMELFFEVCPCKIIAVTGSDGKTTTTSLIADMLKRQGYTVHLGGNIGTPLLSSAEIMSYKDIAVVELSSFQLISMKKCPSIAVVTNVSPNHLDKHKDMAEYVGAKRNIFINQESGDKAIFNLDNEITLAFSKEANGQVKLFSRKGRVENGFYIEGGAIYEAIGGQSEFIIETKDINLPGVHNHENIIAAFSAVSDLVSRETMAESALSFRGAYHRLELVRELRGVRYYNDSVASGPTRTIAGLRAFDRKVILIAGGQGKGISFDELGGEIVRRVKTLVLTGATSSTILNAVITSPEYRGYPTIVLCADMKEAVYTAADKAREGDIVLLSPASTSFDRYKNFEERGKDFCALVKGLD